jgi:hypothetical protein
MSKLIERLDVLKSKSTPGTWRLHRDWESYSIHAGLESKILEQISYYPTAPSWEDTQLIAELQNAYPKLRAVVEAAEVLVRDPESGLKVHVLWGALAALEEEP